MLCTISASMTFQCPSLLHNIEYIGGPASNKLKSSIIIVPRKPSCVVSERESHRMCSNAWSTRSETLPSVVRMSAAVIRLRINRSFFPGPLLFCALDVHSKPCCQLYLPLNEVHINISKSPTNVTGKAAIPIQKQIAMTIHNTSDNSSYNRR